MWFINGNVGKLIYRGYGIHDPAEGRFEEVDYVLSYRDLPTITQLREFVEALRKEYNPPPDLVAYVPQVPPTIHGMEALWTAISMLSLRDRGADGTTSEANYHNAVRLLARTPTIAAILHRSRLGEPSVQPHLDRLIAWTSLWMFFRASRRNGR